MNKLLMAFLAAIIAIGIATSADASRKPGKDSGVHHRKTCAEKCADKANVDACTRKCEENRANR